MRATVSVLTGLLGFLIFPYSSQAEFRWAKDMQKECRVALTVLQGRAENNSTNALLAGECVGYVQGAVDASMALAENVSWYKICAPDNLSTQVLIQKFIVFVDANPKYTHSPPQRSK
jgi:hypothetical protein